MKITDELFATPLLRSIPHDRLAETAGMWHARRLAAGEVLWREGETAIEIALVVEGSLEVVVDGHRLNTVMKGEMMGEGAAFLQGAKRTALVRALGETRLLLLGAAELTEIRAQQSELYDLLLDRALTSLSQRVHDNMMQLARSAESEISEPRRRASSQLKKVWQRFSLKSSAPPPPSLPALRGVPVLQHAHADRLRAIGAAMTPAFVEAGEALYLQGDPGDSAYIVAEGQLDVLCNVAAGGAVRLTTIEQGSVVGTGGLVLAKPRNSSCIATAPSWVWAIQRAAFMKLAGEPGRLLREALLVTLRSQVVSADKRLAKLEAVRRTSGERDQVYDQLLQAAGSAAVYKPERFTIPIKLIVMPAENDGGSDGDGVEDP